MGRLLSILLLLPAASPHPGQGASGDPLPAVGTVPATLREARQIDPFYQKHLAVAGFPILGSVRVSDAALREAAWILRHMLAGRDDILAALAANGVHLAVMAYTEYTTDVPEHRDMEPRIFWDRRARGLGGSPVSCAEENLLGFPGDPYATENILLHEFAHIVHGSALRTLDPTFDGRLGDAYRAALDQGLWEGTYAAVDCSEYWAEGVQSWFDDNRENDSLHNHVNTRAELRAHDPTLATLCAEVLGDGPWRYVKPARRAPADRAHLAEVDFGHLPRFVWREEPIPPRARVLIQTRLGDIEVELDHEHAPRTVETFLHHVHQGFYSDGPVLRAFTADNQPGEVMPIVAIEVGADPARQGELRPPIPLERTRDTGIRHQDGTLSMVRAGPDSAPERFLICLDDQPELDFGGRRHPDGQGSAAFGRVVTGMDVVRRIHALLAGGRELDPTLAIQRAIRRN
ncbi:MAG: peptidylprolyl isomerase [Planctomycetota bacterium]